MPCSASLAFVECLAVLVLVNAVGLTPRLLPLAPRLHALADRGWVRPLRETHPAVTCTAQATLLTGNHPDQHGIVGNGWLFRDTGEVRFWQQSNRLLQSPPLYQQRRFSCAKLFWWFNQGADVAISVTPKPYYGADGNKIFAILSSPPELAARLEAALGPFPFPTFWGPLAGLPCTEWIARAAADVVRLERPDLTLVYLPHLDYDLQRFGPAGSDLPRLLGELDAACAPLLDAVRAVGARVWVVSEYGHCSVTRVVEPNRALRRAGLLSVRPGPFGETLDTFASRAFAVCDHQLAHVYVRDPGDLPRVRDVLALLDGVARLYDGDARDELRLRHDRSGEIIALATPDAWFAYPYWLDERAAPDFARTVDIHRKPGYDPVELFFDPRLWWPKGRAMLRLIQKKLGFRTLFDVVPLDARLVKGSHGLPANDAQDGPLLIGDGPAPAKEMLEQTEVREWIERALGA
jgi:predicted AlkP superfamily pyrophosphatase or phosphodiesterase